jgi:HlyD family secretion protein
VNKSLLNFWKKPFRVISLVLVLIIIYLVFFRGSENLDVDLAIVGYGNLANEINVTGRVKASREVNLGFEKIGRVSSVSVNEGGQVYAGQILARLENSSILADLDKAKAKLKAERASLAQLRRGSRPEEIIIQETKVENTKASLQESKQALLDEIKKSFTTADDAIRNNIDPLFSDPRGSSPVLKVSTNNPQIKIDVEFGRVVIESILNDLQVYAISLDTNDNLIEVGSETKNKLLKIGDFLDKIALIVNSLNTSASLSQATIDSYRSEVSIARINIDATKSSMSTDTEGLVSATSALNLENKNLELSVAGSDPQQILIQEAVIEGAEADIKKIEVELQKTLLVSPIDGVVSFLDIQTGEIVSANGILVSVISDKSLQVEVNVPESDVVLIGVGNKARINLDAYGRDIDFAGTVVSINPGEVILQGVPAYETVIQFEKEDGRIRPGMTADIFILVGIKENVLSVPRRAVLKDGDREYVRMLNNGEIIERDVKTGFKGSDGRIEILSGLEDGEEFVVFLEEKK